MRKLLLFLGLLALPATSQAQIGQYISVLRYDLASTSVIYCSGGPDWVQGTSTVSTSGSSTTLTAATAGTFDAVSAGDAILVNGNFRMIASKASGTSLTLSSAINTTATGWRYIHFTCGTGADAGAFTVSNWEQATVSVDITTMTATSIEARLECRNQTPDSNWNVVYPTAGNNECGAGTEASGYCSFTAAATLDIVIDEPHAQCRVGLKVSTDTAGAESINVSAIGATRPR
jgi:hypothetical protein